MTCKPMTPAAIPAALRFSAALSPRSRRPTSATAMRSSLHRCLKLLQVCRSSVMFAQPGARSSCDAEVGGAERDPGLEAGLPAGPWQYVDGGAVVDALDPRVVGQLGEPQPVAARQPVLRWECDVQRVNEQRADLHRGRHLKGHDRELVY